MKNKAIIFTIVVGGAFAIAALVSLTVKAYRQPMAEYAAGQQAKAEAFKSVAREREAAIAEHINSMFKPVVSVGLTKRQHAYEREYNWYCVHLLGLITRYRVSEDKVTVLTKASRNRIYRVLPATLDGDPADTDPESMELCRQVSAYALPRRPEWGIKHVEVLGPNGELLYYRDGWGPIERGGYAQESK